MPLRLLSLLSSDLVPVDRDVASKSTEIASWLSTIFDMGVVNVWAFRAMRALCLLRAFFGLGGGGGKFPFPVELTPIDRTPRRRGNPDELWPVTSTSG